MPVPNRQLFIDLSTQREITVPLRNFGIPIGQESITKALLSLGDNVGLDIFFLTPADSVQPDYEAVRYASAVVKVGLGVIGTPEGGFFRIIMPARSISVTDITAGVVTTSTPHSAMKSQPLRFSSIVGGSGGISTSKDYYIIETGTAPNKFTVTDDGAGDETPSPISATSATADLYALATNPPHAEAFALARDRGLTFEATAKEIAEHMSEIKFGLYGLPRPLYPIIRTPAIGGERDDDGNGGPKVTGSMTAGFLIQMPGGPFGGNFDELEVDTSNLIPPCEAVVETVTNGEVTDFGDDPGDVELQYVRFVLEEVAEATFSTEIVPSTTIVISQFTLNEQKVDRILFTGLRGGGYYTLTFTEGTTEPISYKDDAPRIQAAINRLMGSKAVTVAAFDAYRIEITHLDTNSHTSPTLDATNLLWLYGWHGALDLSDAALRRIVLYNDKNARDVTLEVELTPSGAAGPTTAYQNPVTIRRDLIQP